MSPHRRGPWSNAEDGYLMQLVQTHGPLNWVRIAQTLATRTPKQCRERYHQNLKPTLNHDPITPEEGVEIERLVLLIGKRWAEIARRLNGRSDNAVKNWWNGNQNRKKRLDARQAGLAPGDLEEHAEQADHADHAEPAEEYSIHSDEYSNHSEEYSRRHSAHSGYSGYSGYSGSSAHSRHSGHPGHSRHSSYSMPSSYSRPSRRHSAVTMATYDGEYGRTSTIPRRYQEPSPWHPLALPSPRSFRSDSVDSGSGLAYVTSPGEMPVPLPLGRSVELPPLQTWPPAHEGKSLPSLGELSGGSHLDMRSVPRTVLPTAPSSPVPWPVREAYPQPYQQPRRPLPPNQLPLPSVPLPRLLPPLRQVPLPPLPPLSRLSQQPFQQSQHDQGNRRKSGSDKQDSRMNVSSLLD